MNVAREATSTKQSGTLLLVDDEPHILSSLRRLLRPLGHKIVLANGGAEGLEIIEANQVDVVISDMRMPEMNGAVFLATVAEKWPDTVRMLLTGYSDIESAVAAINSGNIYRYLNKPWDDEELKSIVNQAVEIGALTREKHRLEALTRSQNEELRELNGNLEAKVADRTEEVRAAHQQLKTSYMATIEVFASLLQSRGGRTNEEMRNIADHARAIAQAIGAPDDMCKHVHLAGVLCELGKMTLPDEIIGQPYSSLSPDDKRRFQQHPAIAEEALLSLQPLEEVATFIRQHCEQMNGSGYPDGLVGDQISLGARALGVAKDFDALIRGFLVGEELTDAEAIEYLKRNAGQRYDPAAVEAFVGLLEKQHGEEADLAEFRLTPENLEPGMVLTRDLFNPKRVLILPKNHILQEDIIVKLQGLKSNWGGEILAYVHPPKGEDDE